MSKAATGVTERVIRVKLGTDIPLELADVMDAWCRARRVRKNLLVELAVRRFLAAAGVQDD